MEPQSQRTTAAAFTTDVPAMLAEVSAAHGVVSLSELLRELRDFMGGDLAEIEAALAEMAAPDPAQDGDGKAVHHSARYLLGLSGKRLRPLCVALAARVGSGFGAAARELAIAVELVHNATLLHDDVIDQGDRRRGVPTARIIYGNAASIYAGDWLLVDALRRIQRAGISGLLDMSLSVLNEILEAEAVQLANRGNVRGTLADHFRVVEGKTASLFRWALFAGGRAGGVPLDQCAALERYGRNLGVAFQIVDDCLDVAGDPTVVGKSLFADLHEGKMTYPLLLAIEHDARLGDAIEAACRSGARFDDPGLEQRIAVTVRESGVIDKCLAHARKLSDEAIETLQGLPPSRARTALQRVALALVHRQK